MGDALLASMRRCGCLSFIVCTAVVCIGIVTETDALLCCRSGRSIGNAHAQRVVSQMSAKGFGGSTSASGGKASATRSGKAGGGGCAQSDVLYEPEPPARTPKKAQASGKLLPSSRMDFEV